MSKVKAVEGIRGIACFIVVISHLRLTFFPNLHKVNESIGENNQIQSFIHNAPFGFIYSGKSAVFIFFVLSGYILTYVALKNNIHKLTAMSLKRYPRLMIPSVVSCMLAYFFFHFFSFDNSILTSWVTTGYGKFNYSFSGAIYSGTVESFLIGISSYNPVLWTMQIELIGSFIIFILCFSRYRHRATWIDFCVLTVLFLLTGFKLLPAILGLGLIAFTIGYLFCIYGKNIQSKLSIPLFIVGLYLAGIHNDSSSYSVITSIVGPKSYILGNLVSGVAIVYSIIFSHNLNALFSKKIFIFMGKVSFSVYLIHFPLISTLGVLLFNFFYQTFSYEESAALSSIITTFSIYIFSILYFNYVDRLGMNTSNKIQRAIVNIYERKK
ncbi:MAG: acyltransferase [Methylococcales bacterium]|nr:acyltransferase [Methylococcales bacterium]